MATKANIDDLKFMFVSPWKSNWFLMAPDLDHIRQAEFGQILILSSSRKWKPVLRPELRKIRELDRRIHSKR